ncbi:hypothetical protein GOP47_0030760 [Adiantum capillus-veneris]|nr:hypothetical protein GOP47_0030760 [Adiantum capillus-veneris]
MVLIGKALDMSEFQYAHLPFASHWMRWRVKGSASYRVTITEHLPKETRILVFAKLSAIIDNKFSHMQNQALMPLHTTEEEFALRDASKDNFMDYGMAKCHFLMLLTRSMRQG